MARFVARRRAVLAAGLALPIAACAGGVATPSPTATPPAGPAADLDRSADAAPALAALESRFDARVGVWALDTGTGRTVAHRADEAFAFCSTFKVMAAAAVLSRRSWADMDVVRRYTPSDLMASSQITRTRVTSGMSLRELCDAAVRFSDGTAGNMLLREIGGPGALTSYLRGLGDPTTRMDRWEPVIADAVPGDPRDTTSPRAFGADYRHVVLGDALAGDRRAFLRDLMMRNQTPPAIRTGVPAGWTVANKTGHGDYGARNDFAVVWPPSAPPLVVAVMSSKARRDADGDSALITEATRRVVATVTG